LKETAQAVRAVVEVLPGTDAFHWIVWMVWSGVLHGRMAPGAQEGDLQHGTGPLEQPCEDCLPS